MLEEHGIRYPAELRSGSDQPFTIRAVVAARRIAVRADYEFYYAVRRSDSSNITYRTSLDHFVKDAAIVMDTAADVITDPEARAKVLRRHFTWELGKLLGPRFLKATRAEQERVQDGIRKLAETYLTDEIRASLDVHRRVPLSIAQFGTLDDLIAAIRHYDRNGLAPVVSQGEHYYIAYPGFQDTSKGFPDDWFDASRQVRQLVHQTGPAKVYWGRTAQGRRALLVGWHSSLPNLRRADEPTPRVLAGDRVAAYIESGNDDGGGTGVLAEFTVDGLVAGERHNRRRKVRFIWTTLGESHSLPVTALDLTAAPRILHRRGLRFYQVGTDLDQDTQLRVVVYPITPRRIAGRLKRRLRRKR
jgi:hypothetical protein